MAKVKIGDTVSFCTRLVQIEGVPLKVYTGTVARVDDDGTIHVEADGHEFDDLIESPDNTARPGHYFRP